MTTSTGCAGKTRCFYRHSWRANQVEADIARLRTACVTRSRRGPADRRQSDEGLLELYRDTESIIIVAAHGLLTLAGQLRDSVRIATAQLAGVYQTRLTGNQIAHGHLTAQ
jgi:hypothetical protein